MIDYNRLIFAFATGYSKHTKPYFQATAIYFLHDTIIKYHINDIRYYLLNELQSI